MIKSMEQKKAPDSVYYYPEIGGLENLLAVIEILNDWQVKPDREAYSFTKNH